MAPPHLRPWRKYQYDVTTGPIAPVAPPIDVDGFYESWTQPVRKLVIATALIATSGNAIGEPVFVTPPPSPTGTAITSWDSNDVAIRAPVRLQYQAVARPTFVPEVITPDKWIYAWSEPVRLPNGLKVQYQQTFIAPPMEDSQEPGATYESPWHQPWSEPVVKARQRTPWFSPFKGDTAAVPTINEGLWHQPWTEPVRLRQLATAQQPTTVTAPTVAETITVDKWVYPWTEPVRQKPGLATALQSTATLQLDDETQIIQTYESRWHFTWSEPVRTKPWLQTTLQQAQIQGFVFSPELVTVDKWVYPWSEPVRQLAGLKSYLQQAVIVPPFEDTLEPGAAYEAPWHQPWSEPVRFRTLATAHQQSLAFVLDPNTQITQTYESRFHFAWSEPVRFRALATVHQQAIAFGQPLPETITADKWIYPWSEPVRFRTLATAQQQAFTADARTPAAQVGAFAAPFDTTRVVHKRQVQYQAFARNVFPGTEIPTLDKWRIRWPERIVKHRLRTPDYPFAAFQAAQEVPSQGKWLQPWSEPVRLRQLPTALQQATVIPAPSPEPKADNWLYPFSDPVRVAPRTAWFTPFTIDTITVPSGAEEALWHESWSEPVRTRQLATAQQQSLAFILDDATQITQGYESRWHQPWSEPVRVRQLATAQQQPLAATQFVVAFSADRWAFPWSEPVRQKPGLGAHLQSFTAQTVLEPNTEIIQTYESRWHQPWSEPVRTRQLAAAHQQSLVFTSVAVDFFTFDYDKWGFAWSEPVRVKPQLPVALSQASLFAPRPIDTPVQTYVAVNVQYETRFQYQALAAPVLNPETEIEQFFESRWHQPWSEPVRIKPRLQEGLQQTLAQGPVVTPAARVGAFAAPFDTTRISRRHLFQYQARVRAIFIETFTIDKWLQPWSEPSVKVRAGLSVANQPFASTWVPQEVPLEAKWHQPWSEPRIKVRQPTPWYQPFTTDTTPVPTGVEEGLWHQPWSEPIVKAKPYLHPALQITQQQFVPTVVTPTLNFFRRLAELPDKRRPWLATANQPFTSTWIPQEVPLESKWHQPWSEPRIKTKAGLGAWQQQAFAGDPTTSLPLARVMPWFAPWSEPSVKVRRPAAWYQPFTADTAVIPVKRIATWLYPWSEPVRQKLGLKHYLQQTTSLATPPQPSAIVTSLAWVPPFNQPVMVKQWLSASQTQAFALQTTPQLNAVLVTLSATEVNADRASFSIVVGTIPIPPVAPPCVVSVVEIPAVQAAAVSTEELRAHDEAAVSTEEQKAHNEAAVSTEER